MISGPDEKKRKSAHPKHFDVRNGENGVSSLFDLDIISGLYNKQAFFFHAATKIAKNPDKRYDIAVADILEFKIYNNTHGMSKGNKLLREIGRFLQRRTKSINAIAARYSGDQFVCLIEHGDHTSDHAYSSLYEGIAEAIDTEEVVVKFGIYSNVDTALPVSVMCDRAVLALQSIKHLYRKKFARFNSSMMDNLMNQRKIEQSMEQALADEQFRVYYQPKHDVVTGRIIGAEALIRWIHPELGFLSPGEFIPLFEKNGFIKETDLYVWRRTAKNLRRWIDSGLSVVPISVNASRRVFFESDFLEKLMDAVYDNSISPQLMHIEVTESLFTENVAELTEILDKVREAGFMVEMDDFGAGYSSLNTLGSLPLDVVKLDMSFMKNIHNERRNRVLFACINLAKQLDLKTVAEGVETSEQMNILKHMGVDVVQGYYYSKPLPETEFEEYLKNHAEVQKNTIGIKEANGIQSESGVYLVDSNNIIVSFNDAAKEVYPELTAGKNIYACIQCEKGTDNDLPADHKKGPHVRWNSKRQMYENVDVASLEIPGHGKCWLYTFSTVGEEESFAKKYREQELRLQQVGLIETLARDYSDIFVHNLKTGECTAYRFSGKAHGVMENISKGVSYQKTMEAYIRHDVYEPDQEEMLFFTNMEYILQELETKQSISQMYRVYRDGELQYYSTKYMKMDSEFYSDTIVFTYENIDKQIKEKLGRINELENRMDIINGLSAEYHSVLLVDYERDTVTPYRSEVEAGSVIAEFSKDDAVKSTWSRRVQIFADKLVATKERSAFIYMLSRETMAESDGDYSFNYHKVENGMSMPMRVSVSYFNRSDGTRVAVVGTRFLQK